jgi:hypothetical protein
MKRVIVEFIHEDRYSPIPTDEMTEIGVLFGNGQVLVADDLGSTAIHNCVPKVGKENWVIVDEKNDGKDYSEDNPEYIVSLILSGGAK